MEELTVDAGRGRVHPAVWWPGRGDPPGAAALFPGLNYTPARPLLHLTTKALRTAGFGVLEVWYDYRDLDLTGAAGDPRPEFAADAEAALALASEHAEHSVRVAVGKSLGTLHLTELAGRRRLDGVATMWLTPPLDQDVVMDVLRDRSAPTLVVAGDDDPMSPPERLAALDADAGPAVTVVQVAGADHNLERSGASGSLDALAEAVRGIERFLDGLDAGAKLR